MRFLAAARSHQHGDERHDGRPIAILRRVSLARGPGRDVLSSQHRLHAPHAYPAGTAKFFVSIGLPAWLAYATFLAEALGGILLILGIQTRWVALALSPILIGATWAHAGNGWLFASENGGWEYPLYLFVLCIAQAMLGDGAYALAPSRLRDGGGAAYYK